MRSFFSQLRIWLNALGRDVFPQILEERPDVQLITVGPQIDLYGKLAAIKLDELMKRYPKQVCSKPVFTALPPYIFSGSDFALMPSRDEPFGLVAIEFGRKGALGVGSRLGGLGLMVRLDRFSVETYSLRGANSPAGGSASNLTQRIIYWISYRGRSALRSSRPKPSERCCELDPPSCASRH